jgi:hypothetical protein
MSRWLESAFHHDLCFAHRALNGCCEEVLVSCEDRINLYPAVPIRLATMLRAWTIVQRWDGANHLEGSSTGIQVPHCTFK